MSKDSSNDNSKKFDKKTVENIKANKQKVIDSGKIVTKNAGNTGLSGKKGTV